MAQFLYFITIVVPKVLIILRQLSSHCGELVTKTSVFTVSASLTPVFIIPILIKIANVLLDFQLSTPNLNAKETDK